MALSNSERQARYRQKLKERARGVTPEMIVEAVRLDWEAARADDPSMPTWEEHIAACNKGRRNTLWMSNLQQWKVEQFSAETYGENAEMFRNVAAVIEAVVNPPKKDNPR